MHFSICQESRKGISADRIEYVLQHTDLAAMQMRDAKHIEYIERVKSDELESEQQLGFFGITRNGTISLTSIMATTSSRPSVALSSQSRTRNATTSTSYSGNATGTGAAGGGAGAAQTQAPLPPGFENPLLTGGVMLSKGNLSEPIGEPLNVIVSSFSSPEVLTPEGFLLWATSIQFGVSCLGQGDEDSFQYANLGKENPNVRQGSASGNNGVLRWNYGNPSVGTCRQTLVGGNHFRWYIQKTAKSGTAIFLAVSDELSLAQAHKISTNGYNVGRDHLLSVALNPNGTNWGGHYYNATILWVDAGILLNASSENINHPDVALPGQPNQDGRVAVLNITTWTQAQVQNSSSAGARSAAASVLTMALMIALAQCAVALYS
ncbi:hypothetical protein MCUN1_003928 [Malassezia cuniculi]|uniref:Uncharacterized protein n=1 Tax=Malassezia cuniculi TaxID=948313 RepID=A0AAF0JDK6_9BASI|nr:hypothetical protein MCUN1_003928 [Malassezia cuniculi]